MLHPAAHAERSPGKAALVVEPSGVVVTYAALDAASNQVARLLRQRGLAEGDGVLLVLENDARFLDVAWGAQRAGLYYTPVNTRSTAAEIRYLATDTGSRAVVASAGLAATVLEAVDGLDLVLRAVVGGPADGLEPLDDLLSGQPASPLPDQREGQDFLYSSGTTGRPKGIKFPLPAGPLGAPTALTDLFGQLYGMGPDTVYLSPAPLSHSAPLRFSMTVQRVGGTVVVMERFDAEEALRLIERRRVTHAQFVPAMFVKMLRLPEEARRRYDLSSLQFVIHAAAPCPAEVKERMLDWLGPVVYEYYSGTESAGFCAIGPEEWRAHRGSVGRPLGCEVRILGDDGRPLPPGEVGDVFLVGGAAFEYHNDPAKTAKARRPDGAATLGDVGYVDEEGYLYLTDRKDFMIISGGVNVYPQEVEDVLTLHPSVADVAVIGVPDEVMGEVVKAVVQPAAGAEPGPALEGQLIEACRAALAAYKCPRSVDFVDELPRMANGKLYKKRLRAQYAEAAAP
jgi:acyl-CoA synthetase (AMP-forming)/AMP-acid ligase II